MSGSRRVHACAIAGSVAERGVTPVSRWSPGRQRSSALRRIVALAVVVPLVAAACSGSSDDGAGGGGTAVDDLRLNEIQVMGTHNSYRVRPPEALLESIRAVDEQGFLELDYGHRPLAEQFGELGVRQIELDIMADPDGGRFATRGLNEGLGLPAEADPVTEAEMYEPGYKVIHIDDLDYASTCLTFVACLTDVNDWSQANPGHLPIMILVEVKTPTFQAVDPIGASDLDTVDDEIRSVFAAEAIITPDDVRGAAATLREAVTTTGWPTLAASRGKVMFALDNGGDVRDAYLEGHPGLEGRVMFASMESTTDPGAAFFKRNNPLGDDQQEIADLVAEGFVVRTRSDVPGDDAVRNDTARLEAALASGAQWLSSDYLEADLTYSDFTAALPTGGVARCNPVSAPPWCDDALLLTDPGGT